MIFEDPSHRRWRRAVAVFSLLAVAALAALALTLTGGFIPPRVPNPFSTKSVVQKTLVKTSLAEDVRPVYTPQQKKRMQAIRAQERKRRSKLVGDAKGAPMPLPPNAVVAFMMQDDPSSVASLERHVAGIDVIVPDWYELPGPGCNLVERIDDKTRRVLSRSDVIVLPRLANLAHDKWRGPETSKFLADDAARACLIKALVPKLVAVGAEGLNLDLEELRPEDSEPFLEFIVELRAALHAKSMRLTVDVPVSDPAFDYEYIGGVADAVMVMAYDQHHADSKPGPIASKNWFVESLGDLLPRLPPDRAVIILGNYGYDWTLSETPKPAEALSFRAIMDLARVADAAPVFEEQIENVHFGYKDDAGETHEVWFEDALTVYNEAKTLEAQKITRIGLWRLGTEDETLWAFLGADGPLGPQALASIPPVKSVGIYGEGEVYITRREPQSGSRALVASEDGSIARAVYDRVPSGFVVEKRGGKGKQIALTFDDGPDEQNTPLLLDVLKSLKVPAAFFVVGEQAAAEPDLVVREAHEGHLVGNHSYTHPHLETLTPRESAAELAETQRLIEGLTGHRSPLFRAPFIADIDLEQQPDLAVLRIALQNNYLYVGANVDPADWDAPNVDAIVNKTISDVATGVGKIIVCHDGGGDRSKTIAAVRRFVPELRKKGYEFVSLDKLLGIGRDELAAAVPPSERLFSASDAAMAYAKGWVWTTLAVLFFVCTVLSILRILFLGTLTIRDLRNKSPEKPGFVPLVTVIVPAFNEAKVILSTLKSLLSSGYKNLEIVVVDDGSTDDTVAVVTSFVRENPRVRIVSQPNAGKAAAANRALAEARGDIVVAVDADTVVSPDAIPKMVAHFSSPDVTAVCGNVEVGNVDGFITTFQAIEYVTSQNFDRRAFSALNCISVVPGALGAWRREAVLAAGGYSHETLTEDADLTLTILSRGGKVVYEPEACGRTEAPESLGALLRQRFRWTYGTYQCLWKHRTAFFRGTLGWVGLPNMVIFQIVFPLLSPIGDIMMVASVVRGDWQAFLAGYVAFLAMDICGSLLAFTLDRKPLRWLPLLLVQRFTYRQIMYYVCFKAIIAAIRGARHGWRKLDRTGALNPKDLPSRPEVFGNAA
jgi:cellulose synthase/poly-beta-1,6-N-acetylglucosamine synthase-like glycosyltransferase/peptidoglycan/xylan/chitin deacetylase (PgdA/CDA1 family)/spore germination protein YaaH